MFSRNFRAAGEDWHTCGTQVQILNECREVVQFGEARQIGVAGLTSDQMFPGCLVAGSKGEKARVREGK